MQFALMDAICFDGISYEHMAPKFLLGKSSSYSKVKSIARSRVMELIQVRISLVHSECITNPSSFLPRTIHLVVS